MRIVSANDRPAVVADEAVNPVQRSQQRHDDDREHAEVDRLDEIPIDRGKLIEILRADVEAQRLAGLPGCEHEVHHRPAGLRLREAEHRDRLKRDRRAPGLSATA